MQAKMTSKNQTLVPKVLISKLSLSNQDTAAAASDGAEAVRRKIEELGITEADIDDAVKWARANPAKDGA
jgi:hypothetical protein